MKTHWKPILYGLAALGLLGWACSADAPASPSPKGAPATGHSTDPQASAPPVAPCDGFDFPVGPPDAKGYYDAQPFQKNDHLGEDWNGVGGGNTDLGDPVHAVASGRVDIAEDFRGGWGNVVRITHNIGTADAPRHIESLYAHLDSIWVRPGETVRRGQQIGTIGNAHGQYWAHLHLELRWRTGMDLGGGYSADTSGFWSPKAFIRTHRKMGR